MPQQITKPRIIAFELTRRCQLNCRHCRASADTDTKSELDTGQCKNILKAIANYNRCVVVLTGGEPTERDDIYELIKFGNSLGLRIAMATCGYSITDESIAKLKNAGIGTLSFSLDGKDSQTHDSFRQSPGAFDITMAALKKTRKANIRFQINTAVTKSNFDQIDAIAKIAEHSGAYCFNPFILVPVGRGKQIADTILEPSQYEEILHRLAGLKKNNPIELRVTCGPQFVRVYQKLNPGAKVHGCLAGSDFTFISYQGDVQTCGFLPVSAGNLIDNGYDFAQIWEKSDFLNQIRDVKNYKGRCGKCDFLQTCRGCRARAFALTGNYLAADPICAYTPSVSTVVAAHIEKKHLAIAAEAVNSLPNVSHNYLREHHYNLWFTLRDLDFGRIDKTIEQLSKKFKTDFYSFPAVKRYKLDSSAIKRHRPPDVFNALFCCNANSNKSAVEFLCKLPQVSHCFERETLPNWPYNLYAMIHAQSPKQSEEIIDNFVKKFGIEQFQILPTVKSLKR